MKDPEIPIALDTPRLAAFLKENPDFNPSEILSGKPHRKPSALEIAQQIIDQFEPGNTVAQWKAIEDKPNTVELIFTDGTVRTLVGLFAHRILGHAD